MERLKDSEIYAHKYAQLTFYKGAKPNEEGQHFQQTVLKQLDIQRQRGKKKKNHNSLALASDLIQKLIQNK